VEIRPSRGAPLGRLAALLAGRRPAHALRVAIDGPDAAGKTTLAAELAAPEASADVVIDNTDPARPHVVKWPA
jgi:hypothetical protein